MTSKQDSAAVVDSIRQVVRCEVCGEWIPIPLGVAVKWTCAVLDAFCDCHPAADHEPRRTYFSTPTKCKENDE